MLLDIIKHIDAVRNADWSMQYICAKIQKSLIINTAILHLKKEYCVLFQRLHMSLRLVHFRKETIILHINENKLQ